MSGRRVSVVIPVFNGLPYLQETIASVETQTHPNVELVLVDGGSTDGSRELIERYHGDNVVKDYLPIGTSAAANWTRASELATGEYIKLLCQDDLIKPSALHDQSADLTAHPSAGMAIALRDIVSASGALVCANRGCAGLSEGLLSGTRSLEIAARNGANIFGEPLAVLFRRDAMVAALPWDDSRPFLLDMFFYAKVLRSHDVVVRKQSVGAFRISTSSWSTRMTSKQRNQFRAWQEHVEETIPQPWYRIAQARINNEKTAALRRLAYAWLKVKGDLSSS